MLSLSCHCGAIRLTISQLPGFMHECNCTLCSKTGAVWGYFDPSHVNLAGQGSSYRRTDKAKPAVDLHFCRNCGCSTHFTLTQVSIAEHGNTMLGVNMRLADQGELAGIELRFPDGLAWSGQGDYGYVRDPRILGDSPDRE